ncbi:unnamed protein product, partial [Darwinula stevensoni]
MTQEKRSLEESPDGLELVDFEVESPEARFLEELTELERPQLGALNNVRGGREELGGQKGLEGQMGVEGQEGEGRGPQRLHHVPFRRKEVLKRAQTVLFQNVRGGREELGGQKGLDGQEGEGRGPQRLHHVPFRRKEVLKRAQTVLFQVKMS